MAMLTKYRRMQLLRDCDIPALTEVRHQIGSPLAEILFPSLDDETKTMLGLIPLLKGVESKELWMSPSDILIGKVMMTPPMPTRRVVRALTHEGIDEIGGNCLYKIENEHRIDKEQSLLELQAYLESVAKEERERAVALAREEEREKHDKHVEELLAHCREEIAAAVDETEIRIGREMAIAIQEERREVHDLMTDKMITAVREEREILTHLFTMRMLETIRDLNQHYAQYIGGIIAHFHWRLRLVMHQNKQDLLQLRCHLEAQSSADISYAVCRERQRCKAEKDLMQEEYEIQIAELTKFIEMKILELEAATESYVEQVFNNAQWKQRVRDIVKEFQKFINFALKAVPGQAEFLLSLEKLLILELQRPVTVPKEIVAEEEESLAELADASTTMTASAGSYSGLIIGHPNDLSHIQVGVAKTVNPSLYDEHSEGEEIGNYIFDETKTSGENVVGQVINDLIKAATPTSQDTLQSQSNYEFDDTKTLAENVAQRVMNRLIISALPPKTEDIVVPIIRGIIDKSVNLTEEEEIVIPIVDSIVNTATWNEGEEIAVTIVDSIVNHALPPMMFDATTQAPSDEEILEPEPDPSLYFTPRHELRNSLKDEQVKCVHNYDEDSPIESRGKTHLLQDYARIPPMESQGKTHLLSASHFLGSKHLVTIEPSKEKRQDCAWCEIKHRKRLSVCFKDVNIPKTNEDPQSPTAKTSSKDALPRPINIEPIEAQTSSNYKPIVADDSCCQQTTELLQPVETYSPSTVLPEEGTFLERGYVGEGGVEHEQNQDDFVHDRLESLLKIFREHPSLTQVFIR